MPENRDMPAVASGSVYSSLWVAGLFGLLLLLIFYQTTWSMVSIWMRSDTFAHGFLILPIALWLVWDRRHRLRQINPVPAVWVSVLLIPAGFVWLLAWLVDVLVVQQLALVTMLVVGMWAILGHQLARELAFPLFFLFLAVPMGEALVPPLMEFTATSTVWMIQQTGIPVFREGLYFTLPSGSWSVVEACSGVRYVIASITLGILYAYLSYRSLWRRLLFVLASLIVPILANTLRAYLIVIVGHLSEMRLAVGADHLIGGWLLFGLIMFLLFWVGSFWREADRPSSADHSSALPAPAGNASVNLVSTCVIALFVASLWLPLAHVIEGRTGQSNGKIVLPLEWEARQMVPESSLWWRPDGAIGTYYDIAGEAIGLFLQYPDGDGTADEVVGSSTRFQNKDDGFRLVNQDKMNAVLGKTTVLVDQAILRRGAEKILVWSWYRIADSYTSNDYRAKIMEAQASLGFAPKGSYRIVLATPLREDISTSQQLLQGFLTEYGGDLESSFDRAQLDAN